MIQTLLYGLTIGAVLYFFSIGLSITFGTMRIMVTAMTTWTQVEIRVTTVGALMASRTDHTGDQAKRINSPMKVTGVEVRVNIPLL